MRNRLVIFLLLIAFSFSTAWAEDPHTYTRKEAYQESERKIMFHYGEGAKHVTNLAEVLSGDNFTAIALPGAKPGTIYMRVHKSSPVKVTQYQIDNGVAGILARDLFIERVGVPPKKK